MVDLGRMDRFDSDVFSNLINLRRLSVETYPNIEKYRFRLGKLEDRKKSNKSIQKMCCQVKLEDVRVKVKIVKELVVLPNLISLSPETSFNLHGKNSISFFSGLYR